MTTTTAASDEDDTITLQALLDMSIDARLDRAASAAEDAAAALTRIANAADNLGRVADALETLTALFASVVGVGKTTCYGSGNGAEYGPPVNFIRSGQGKDVFACDADNSEIEE